MQNPEIISPQLIYKYNNKTMEPWNIPEYQPPRSYLDPALQIQKRKWSTQLKGQKTNKYLTKRGFYMDYELKMAKMVPGSSTYKLIEDVHGDNKAWSFSRFESLSKKRKMDPKLIKYSYLDRIEIEQKKRKIPGVSTYSLEKSYKEKVAEAENMNQKKKNLGQKPYFYDDTEYLSDRSPGAGNYNPHDRVDKLRKNKTQYQDWIKKHQKQEVLKQKKDSSLPAPGSYSPMNITFTTFDSMKSNKSPKNDKEKHEYFGRDARFPYNRPDKKKIEELRPSPDSYNTIIPWKGKKSPKKKQWYETITKGFATISVYNG